MAITNGTFDTDLSGWTYTSAVTWQSPGKARIYAWGYSCPRDSIQQTFTITGPIISFDYIGVPAYLGIVTIGWDFIVEGSTIISSETLVGTGTRTLDISSHIGKSATIIFKLIAYGGSICVNSWVSLTIDNVANPGTPANVTTTNMVITKTSPCREGTCIVTIVVTWTNSGGTDGTIIPNIKIDNVLQTPHISRTVTANSFIEETFTISGLTIGRHTICPDPN